jgi:1,2-diacylglycerol 3-alpha-glucosyltransferase
MRIGFVADVYKPQISGVTNYILANKRELEKLGHEVFVFAYGPREYDFGEENVIITPGVAFKKTYYVGLGFNRRARDLLASMDIAHLQHPFLSGKQALNICKPKGIPLVFTNHTRYDLYIQYYVSWMPKGLWMAYLRSYLPGFYRQMDLVIAPSPGLREVSAQWGIDVAMEVIPNGIELELFTTNQERRERGELGFSAQDVILVFAGRVVAEKNLRFLLEAFRRVAARYPQAALLILGDGAERKPLLRLVEGMGLAEGVRLPGMIPYAHLPAYLHLADAFVTSSKTEVHPLTLIEAMASGLPLLGVESPGVSDIIQDGINGYLSPDDMEAYTERMMRLVYDGEQRRKMAEAARQDADRYSISNTVRLNLAHYERLIAERRHGG